MAAENARQREQLEAQVRRGLRARVVDALESLSPRELARLGDDEIEELEELLGELE